MCKLLRTRLINQAHYLGFYLVFYLVLSSVILGVGIEPTYQRL
jgi:hypothetical protein